MSASAIKIFVVEDEIMFGKMLQKGLETENPDYDISVFTTGKEFLDNLHQNPHIVTLDYNLPDITGLELLQEIKKYNPDISVIVLSGQEKVDVVVNAYDLGADRYIVKNEKAIVEVVKSVNSYSEKVALKNEVERLRSMLIDRSRYDNLLGESKAIMKVLNLIQKVENNKILVLITGESGTGKDVVAQTIHYNSPRRRKNFVAVNVAAIPEDLIESELFGHEKGAFTGAIGKRIGKFEEANGGTIFLDEIGELDIGLQAKLLRVLQDNKISRLGSNKEIQLDIRVVVATNRDLMELVKEGKFREDLYYRLQGFRIHLPPLRERDNDVIILAKHFLAQFCKANKMPPKTLSKGAIAALMAHDWPGNVRELKSTIERAVLISDSDVVTEDDIMI